MKVCLSKYKTFKSDFMNMKVILLAGSIVFATNAVSGQARETTITLGKDKINAVKVEVNAPAKEVQQAITEQLTSAGVTAKPKKGPANSLTFNDVVVPGISSDTVDLWTRVQKNGNNSVIYMAVKDQQGNYISGDADTASVEKIKDFLYDFARARNYSSNDLEIGALMDSVQTDQTSFEQYSSERAKIESQIKELNTQLQQLEQKSTASRQDMDRRKQRLEQLRAAGEGDVRTGKPRKSSMDNK
jgi:hypothetical protein